MQVLRFHGGGAPGRSDRLLSVQQLRFERGRSHTTVELGAGWASPPQSLTVAGRTIAVTPRHGRTVQGGTYAKYTVDLPLLADGFHQATMKLANGNEVRVTLNVDSVY